jgi:hypothetical protein
MESKKKTKARIDKENAAFYRWFDCVQVNINDLPAIMGEISGLILAGQDLDVCMPSVVARYRKNGVTA